MYIFDADIVFTGANIYAADAVYEDGALAVKDGKICFVNETPAKSLLGYAANFTAHKTFSLPRNWYIVPGFIDMHIHGGYGMDVMDASKETLPIISRALPQEGVTAFLATTNTQAPDKISAAVLRACDYQQSQYDAGCRTEQRQLEVTYVQPVRSTSMYDGNVYDGYKHDAHHAAEINGFAEVVEAVATTEIVEATCTTEFLGAELLGLHLEGPFISPHKAGAQAAQYICAPDSAMLQAWHAMAGDSLKVITLAPEIAGSEELIRYAVHHHIIVAIGHSDASYDEACVALTAPYSCSHATHFFNALPPLQHREPGVAAALLLDSDVTIELIADGIHVHPAMLELALRLKGADKIILITDAIRAKGLDDGDYEFGGQDVRVSGGAAYLLEGIGAFGVGAVDFGTADANCNLGVKAPEKNSRVLAGSVLCMDVAVRNMMQFTGCALSDAIKMASTNPAQKLGVFHSKGSLAVGKDADLVLLNENYEVMLTLCRGEICYMAPDMCDRFL